VWQDWLLALESIARSVFTSMETQDLSPKAHAALLFVLGDNAQPQTGHSDGQQILQMWNVPGQ
jgi:hypothetical protein